MKITAMKPDLLAQLQALPESWVWMDAGKQCVIKNGIDGKGNLAAYDIAVSYDPSCGSIRAAIDAGKFKQFVFTDEDLEPFRKIAKEIGYPSVEHALGHFLETKAYRREDQCPVR
jgi:hypothetical protein